MKTDREIMQQSLNAIAVSTTPLAEDRQTVIAAQGALGERFAQSWLAGINTANQDQEFLKLVVDRLVFWGGESESVDFVLRLRAMATDLGRDAKDAARYRAWRDAVISADDDFVDLIADSLNDDVENPTAEEWDAAIDAAMKAKP